jgi:crooked neck
MSSRGNTGQVKNRAPAPIQISAEQIVREAADRQVDAVVEPVVKVHDAEEYQQHLADRRKLFEDNIRYRREHIGNWVKYARFEEENKELERARSIFERALEVEHRSAELWLRYTEFELRNEFLNHARNVLDRAVQILPRVDFLWYKYVWVEELCQDVPKCRAVFERWMQWRPDDNAWLAYARFELRCNSAQAAESVLRRYCQSYPTAKAFVKFAKWAEFEAQNIALSRSIYEAALQELEPEEVKTARLFQQFAAMEERQTEYERARVIYQHAIKLLHLDASIDKMRTDDDDEDISKQELEKRQDLYKQYVTFEKKHGSKANIESVILKQQRAAYEERLQQDPYDYDGWFEYAKLLQEHEVVESVVRETYERAVAVVPPDDTNKDDWRRYIYLWIYYAVYEELQCKDLDRAVSVYETCLKVIPHKNFSFSKIWILLAQLHVRRKDLVSARKLLGRAIGVCGKERIYTEYIALELALGEVDRCRTLYTNYLKVMPYNSQAWFKYAGLEQSVGETERCRAIYELAVQQPALDMPELLWKAYIDFEIEEGDGARARKLYERLLEKTGHVKVWISFAQFESTAIGKGITGAREVFETAYQQLKQLPGGSKEERVLLLDAWRVLEKAEGDAKSVADMEAKMPRRIKRKRMREDEDGNELGWEEYFDYQFPDDEATGGAAASFKILEMAAKWKEQQQKGGDSDEDSDLDSDDDDDE